MPKSILHEDLDRGFLDFVKNDLSLVVDGKKVPVVDILITTQNWAQFTKTWNFNDLDKNASCQVGDTLFIKSKKNKTFKEEFTIQNGETLHQLSQRFGIKLEKILDRNEISLGQEPANGEVIYFNKKINNARLSTPL